MYALLSKNTQHLNKTMSQTSLPAEHRETELIATLYQTLGKTANKHRVRECYWD